METNKHMCSRHLIFLLSLVAFNIANAGKEIFQNESSSVVFGLHAQTAVFSDSNAWFGEPKTNVASSPTSWWEGVVEPGIKANYTMPNSSSLYGEYSYSFAKTIGDDPSGLTNDPDSGMTEQAYIGWRSGNAIGSLDEDAIDISGGRLDYKLGTGFLLYTGSGSGGGRGAYWIGTRHTFKDSFVARFNHRQWKLDGFHLKTNPKNRAPNEYQGFNFEYQPNDTLDLGFTYIHVKDSGKASIKGMDVWNIRGRLDTIPNLPGLYLSGEYAFEDNGSLLESEGGYLEVGYQWKELNWAPTLSYRYASLEGDDPNTAQDEAFDGLAYGFNDWNTWFQGEIVGEYLWGHSNLVTHTARLKMKPVENITLNIIYNHFSLDRPESAGATSDHLADEFNFIVDAVVNESLSISAVMAIAVPGNAAEQITGGNKNWLHGMLYASYKY